MFLTAIIDLYSRKILAWKLSNAMDVEFCLSCLKEAIRNYGVPAIFNSDQGSQYTSKEFTKYLLSLGVRISMDDVGRCIDDVICERCWKSVKYECVFLNSWLTLTQMRNGIGDYIIKFNRRRVHQGLGYLVPDEMYYNAFPVNKELDYICNVEIA